MRAAQLWGERRLSRPSVTAAAPPGLRRPRRASRGAVAKSLSRTSSNAVAALDRARNAAACGAERPSRPALTIGPTWPLSDTSGHGESGWRGRGWRGPSLATCPRLMQQSGQCRGDCCSCACYQEFVANGGGRAVTAPMESCIAGAGGQPWPCRSAWLVAFHSESAPDACSVGLLTSRSEVVALAERRRSPANLQATPSSVRGRKGTLEATRW